MPLPKNYSSFWYHVVPWVLPVHNNVHSNEASWNWDNMQQCIHGTTNYQAMMSAQVQAVVLNINACDDRKPSTITIDQQLNEGKSKEKPNLGMKFFPSNQIEFLGKEYYLDKFQGLVIIPILSIEEVKAWNGTSYNAIVLAIDQSPIRALNIYQYIHAERHG
jgi:hypothetical protein